MSKILGGILLIVGTSIGGGMLALPIATAGAGFLSSSLLLVVAWAIMTIGAFFLLEVNLWLPQGTNMISMAQFTLGRPGVWAVWLSYIFLLYALLCAYISGGSALFYDLLVWLGWHTAPPFIASLLFVLVFGWIVYRGIRPVDYVNRTLMAIKMGALSILIAFALPYVDLQNLSQGHPKFLLGTVTVMMTSFGFATIVPSLRRYFEDDVKKIRFVIFIGSLIPLLCYLFWEYAILGTLPRTGEKGLLAIYHGGGDITELSESLSYYLQSSSITLFSHVFTVICVLTAFLGVSLGLTDFFADAFKKGPSGKGNVRICAMTFLPPLMIVIFFPNIFIKALNYAGVCGVILLVLLPILMVWRGRYFVKTSTYKVMGGEPIVLFSFFMALLVILIGIVEIIIH